MPQNVHDGKGFKAGQNAHVVLVSEENELKDLSYFCASSFWG